MALLARTIAILAAISLFVWAFFAVAGRWDWMAGWAYIAILTMGSALNELLVWRKTPELLRRRARFGAGTKTWDKFCLGLFGLTYLVTIGVGVLDAGRVQWSYMTVWLLPVGVILFVAGQALVTWSMLANPFFEKTARIQRDRDHQVIDSGPYRLIRHPGYAGTIVGFILGTPMMLGSWWAFVPAATSIATLVARTALEDRMLLTELEGYGSYAARVRYRLIPYLW